MMKSGLNSEDGKTLILKNGRRKKSDDKVMLVVIKSIQINYHLSKRNIL